MNFWQDLIVPFVHYGGPVVVIPVLWTLDTALRSGRQRRRTGRWADGPLRRFVRLMGPDGW